MGGTELLRRCTSCVMSAQSISAAPLTAEKLLRRAKWQSRTTTGHRLGNPTHATIAFATRLALILRRLLDQFQKTAEPEATDRPGLSQVAHWIESTSGLYRPTRATLSRRDDDHNYCRSSKRPTTCREFRTRSTTSAVYSVAMTPKSRRRSPCARNSCDAPRN